MKTLRTLALASLIGLSGCGGFTDGLKHAVTGSEVTTQDQAQRGYDYGVLLGNVLIYAFGAVTRHYAAPLIEKKKDDAVK